MELEIKSTHAQAGYESPAKGLDHCSDCVHFIQGNPPRCEIVQSPIWNMDWCQLFADWYS